MPSGKIKDKNEYQKRIWGYLKKRENFKKTLSPIRYKIRAETVNKRLSVWRRQIIKIELKEWFIKRLHFFIEDYFFKSAKRQGNKQESKSSVHRNVFYKYGLEHGCSGRALTQFLGFSDAHNASRGRKRIIKSEETKKIYRNFIEYMKSINGGKELTIPKNKREIRDISPDQQEEVS